MRARLAVWWRMESASVGQPLDLRLLAGDQLAPAGPRRRPGPPGTGSRCPCTRPARASSRCSTRVMASSRRSRSWLTTSRAPAVGAQEAHEPVLGVAVEVVGGLVEQQDVAAGEEDAGQLDPPPLATREHPERAGRCGRRRARDRRPAGAPRTRRRSRPRAAKASSALAKRAMARSDGCSSMAIRSFSSRSAASSRPRPGQDVGQARSPSVACRGGRGDPGSGTRAGPGPCTRARGRRQPRRRGPSAGWSCPRRCGPPGRPCRRRAPGRTPPPG